MSTIGPQLKKDKVTQTGIKKSLLVQEVNEHLIKLENRAQKRHENDEMQKEKWGKTQGLGR